MNELELFTRWFHDQNRYVIKKRKDYDYSGNISLESVIEAYETDRDYTIVKEIILKHIKEAKDNQYLSDEGVVENIVREMKKLNKDAF